MADDQDDVTYGQMMAVVERLDDRISSLDRNLTEMRTDIRHLTNWLIGLYLFILAVAGAAITLLRTAPPAS
jgi:hypothetical protein